jgi:hypothetical protein
MGTYEAIECLRAEIRLKIDTIREREHDLATADPNSETDPVDNLVLSGLAAP